MRRAEFGAQTFDAQNGLLLQSCIEVLDRAIPEANDPAGAEYCRRLHQLAVLVSRNRASSK